MGHFTRMLFLVAGVAVFCPASVLAECGPRPVNACALVNDDAEIFVGRVLSGNDDNPFEWRMRVVRTYRGSATGEILVDVYSTGDLPSPAGLEVGDDYLFYASKTVENGEVRFATELACGTWLPLSAVSRDELAFLGRLNGPAVDGRVTGTLVHVLNFRDREPLAGIRILLHDGKTTYAGTTDQAGRFEISGLPPGSYRVATTVSPTMLVEGDAEFDLVSHGCFYAYLMAEDNTTISGRITLPPGIRVTGTQVSALSSVGRVEKSTFADPEGRYTIPGLPPGEYVIGINAGQYPPRVEAPFPATYAPGVTDMTQASTFQMSGIARFTDVDIVVTVPSEILTVNVKAVFDDGRPVQGSRIRLTMTGYGEHGGSVTNAEGIASVSVLSGVRVYLLGGADSRCVAPLALGPEIYPETIEVRYTVDGCREELNLSHLGQLQASVGDKLGRVPLRVTFPDGTPVDKAQVAIISQRPLAPFRTTFLTDRDGHLELPVPISQEFRIDASFRGAGVDCRSVATLFNTERGIRWLLWVDRTTQPNWDDVTPSTDEVQLRLEGPSCRPVAK